MGPSCSFPAPIRRLDFVLAPDLADRLATQRIEGKLALRLIFRPLGSQLRKDACMWLGGGRVVKMEIEILGTALVTSDGTVLSRGDTGEYADSSSVLPVRSPKVTVRRPRGVDGKDVAASVTLALGVLAERAQPCYERVLIARPALRGTLVVWHPHRSRRAGRIGTRRDELSRRRHAGELRGRQCGESDGHGTSGGQRFSVPLQFASADER